MIDETDLGLVYAHILYHADDQRITPAWMTEELEQHGYEYSNEEIEHGMRNLVAKGLLETDESEYWITDNGSEHLTQMKQKVTEAASEIT